MKEAQYSHTFLGGQQFWLVQGDLTMQDVDAIVNAANNQLQHGGGVAGVISRAGGPVIQQESDAWVRQYGPVSHAKPAYTSAGTLPQKYVIHAVGPVWGSGDENRKLADAIRGSLHLAEELEMTSIAFPAVSTGIFGFPKMRAARVIYKAMNHYFGNHLQSKVRDVRMVLYDRLTLQTFQRSWNAYFSEE